MLAIACADVVANPWTAREVVACLSATARLVFAWMPATICDRAFCLSATVRLVLD